MLIRLIVLLLVQLTVAGCQSEFASQESQQGLGTDPAMPLDTNGFDPVRITPDRPGLHNLLRIHERLYSGSEPEGDEGFASLAKLGIKTVVSVDGVRPNVEAASKYGLRYIHIPIGYDGIPASAASALTRVAREATAPIYVHCHHGKHRGPAAAALLCQAAGRLSGDDAKKVLQLAGTGPEYAGLWRDVAAYQPPDQNILWPDLLEVAEVESLAAAMAKLDRHWDQLKLCRDARWQSPPTHPDIIAEHEALLVRELLQEAHRTTPATDYDPRFHEWFSASESLAEHLEQSLKQRDHDAATARVLKLEQSCKQCHQTYRN
ncbi:MAG: cytochrome c [Planctomycetaceae bacterium]